MKARKVIAMLSAAVMSLCALPMASVSAASAAVPGDVDGDGVLTGHDLAMISRYLVKGDIPLTDAQLALADVNKDDVVDKTDMDWIYDNMTYGLIGSIGNYSTLDNVAYVNLCRSVEALVIAAREGVGMTIHITDDIPTEEDIISATPTSWSSSGEVISYTTTGWMKNNTLTQVQYNLLDVDADGVITSRDGMGILSLLSNIGCMSLSDYNDQQVLERAFHGNYYYGG